MENGVESAILNKLDNILRKLEEAGFVHGDFRANKIMVKPGDEESVETIDFDWAGKDGEVFYPLYRNDQGVRWPDKAGSSIRLGHDRDILCHEPPCLDPISAPFPAHCRIPNARIATCHQPSI